MAILPRDKNRCGYSKRFLLQCPSITQNVLRIQKKTTVAGVPVETVAHTEFDAKAYEVRSVYNPPSMRMTMTRVSNGYALVSNITFVNTNGVEKTVQFLCVDGTNLSSSQYEDADTIINMVNSGKLAPMVINDLTNLNDVTLSKTDAYGGSIWYCLFLWEVFGRVGLIDDSHVFLSVVNVPMANAFWNGFLMTYGSGIEPGAPSMKPLTSLDVISHEATHGVIEALGNLEYQGESGALNESIADIFGTCLEKYFDIRADRSLFDWDLGEDFMSGSSRSALRSLSNPKAFQQPNTYKGENWFDTRRQEDQGGVHCNSGVNNYWYYCVATANKGTNDNGTNYQIPKEFEMFKLCRLIYFSLQGFNGYQKVNQFSTYTQYMNCILGNAKKFIGESNIDVGLESSLEEGFVAVGLKSRAGSPQEPGPTDPENPLPGPTDPTPGPEDPQWPPIPDDNSDGDDFPWPTPGPEGPTDPFPIPNPWPFPPQDPCPIPNPQPPQDPNWPPIPQWPPNFPIPFPTPQWPPQLPPWFPQFPDWMQFPWSQSVGCGQLTTYNPNSFRSIVSAGFSALKAKIGFGSPRYAGPMNSFGYIPQPVKQSRFSALKSRFGF